MEIDTLEWMQIGGITRTRLIPRPSNGFSPQKEEIAVA